MRGVDEGELRREEGVCHGFIARSGLEPCLQQQWGRHKPQFLVVALHLPALFGFNQKNWVYSMEHPLKIRL